jgi:putative phosphoesterase
MRLALVSDIHGNLAALEAVAADISRRGVDTVVNLGDSLSGPLLPRETAQFLMAQGWLSLAGNHERQLLACADHPGGPSDQYAWEQLGEAELAWLRSQPQTHRLDDILLCHGTPTDDCVYLLETVHHGVLRLATAEEVDKHVAGETAPLIACGHTHVPRAVRRESGQLIVNPGSVGLQGFDDEHPSYHVMETGSPDARYAIVEKTTAGWLVEQFTVPYPYKSMAELARKRIRPDWEIALLTGYMR